MGGQAGGQCREGRGIGGSDVAEPHDFMPERFRRRDECQDVGIGAQDGETHEGMVGKGKFGVRNRRGMLVVQRGAYLRVKWIIAGNGL